MTAIGSLMFCNDCGTLLDANTGSKTTTLKCNVCGTTCQGRYTTILLGTGCDADIHTDTSAKVIITKSKPSDYPSPLRSKHSQVQKLTAEDMQTDATIRQTCDKCGRQEVRYYAQQMRSADEGTTVFYTCDCGHKCVQAVHYAFSFLDTDICLISDGIRTTN